MPSKRSYQVGSGLRIKPSPQGKKNTNKSNMLPIIFKRKTISRNEPSGSINENSRSENGMISGFKMSQTNMHTQNKGIPKQRLINPCSQILGISAGGFI